MVRAARVERRTDTPAGAVPRKATIYIVSRARKCDIYTLFKNRVLTTARDGVKLRLALGDKEC